MTESKKKEKVLHTRITDDLDKRIKKKADSLGVSVSNLVRNTLYNTFNLVEDLVSDSAAIAKFARSVSGTTRVDNSYDESSAQSFPSEILGWQEMILNLNSVCSNCNEILPKGTPASIAVIEGNGQRPVICQKCVKESIIEPGSISTEI